mmetsp:Transcript_3849/g.10954  ORF Transcript_3849/g.10954 Transcript_3849/m.10954 type:complete len:354 (-) Transcript_3849:133-1194(-)
MDGFRPSCPASAKDPAGAHITSPASRHCLSATYAACQPSAATSTSNSTSVVFFPIDDCCRKGHNKKLRCFAFSFGAPRFAANNCTGTALVSLHLPLPGGTKGLRHALHRVLVPADVHAGDPGNLADPAPQLLVARRHDEALPLRREVGEAVVGVALLGAVARDPLEARVLGEPQGDLVLAAQLFELGHDAVRDAGDALGEQAIHHGPDHVEFFADAKVDKVGVHQNVVRRTELFVVSKKQRGVGLFDLPGFLFLLFLGQLLGLGFLHRLSDARVVGRHHPLGHGEFAGLFGFSHCVLPFSFCLYFIDRLGVWGSNESKYIKYSGFGCVCWYLLRVQPSDVGGSNKEKGKGTSW